MSDTGLERYPLAYCLSMKRLVAIPLLMLAFAPITWAQESPAPAASEPAAVETPATTPQNYLQQVPKPTDIAVSENAKRLTDVEQRITENQAHLSTVETQIQSVVDLLNELKGQSEKTQASVDETRKLKNQITALEKERDELAVEKDKASLILKNYEELKAQLITQQQSVMWDKLAGDAVFTVTLLLASLLFALLRGRYGKHPEKHARAIHTLQVLNATLLLLGLGVALHALFSIFQTLFYVTLFILSSLVLGFKEQISNIISFYSNTLWEYRAGQLVRLPTGRYGVIEEIRLTGVRMTDISKEGQITGSRYLLPHTELRMAAKTEEILLNRELALPVEGGHVTEARKRADAVGKRHGIPCTFSYGYEKDTGAQMVVHYVLSQHRAGEVEAPFVAELLTAIKG